MNKFFDFCDKLNKLSFACFLWCLLCIFFPLASYIKNLDTGEMSNLAPYIIMLFASSPNYAVCWYAVSIIAIISLFVSSLLRPSKKSMLLFCMIFLSLILAFAWNINQFIYSLRDGWTYDIDTAPNAIAMLVLFFLYIVYLLLRRYYAPAKARIQASRAERQANRKPTKAERIAELERKVAELESKDKDEQ